MLSALGQLGLGLGSSLAYSSGLLLVGIGRPVLTGWTLSRNWTKDFQLWMMELSLKQEYRNVHT